MKLPHNYKHMLFGVKKTKKQLITRIDCDSKSVVGYDRKWSLKKSRGSPFESGMPMVMTDERISHTSAVGPCLHFSIC